MMRRWKYLIASLVLSGSMAVFTGCIDTDEPNGITELRGAKAELIKAQAALKLADVSYREAETALKQAEVEAELIKNRVEEFNLELKRLEVDLKEAQNEKEMAALQQQIDLINNAREKAAEEHKEAMLIAEKATAQAQADYDNAIKAIEIAQLLLSKEEVVILNGTITKLNSAKKELTNAYSAVVDAQKQLNTALLNYSQQNIEANLNLKLARAESQFKADTKRVEKIQELLEQDVVATDWEAELNELNDKLEELDLAVAEAAIERERIKVANHEKKINIQNLEKVLIEVDKEEVELDEYEKIVTESNIIHALDAAASTLEIDTYNNGVFYYAGGSFTNQAYMNEEVSDDATRIIDTLESWLKLVAEAGVVNQEEVEWQKVRLAEQLVKVNSTTTEAEKAIKDWKEAKKTFEEASTDADKQLALSDLQSASTVAFGSVLEVDHQPRLTEPTTEEIKEYIANGGAYSQLGVLGEKLEAIAEYDRIKNVVEQANLYITLATELDNQLNAVYKTINDNRAIVDTASTALDDAQAEYDSLFDELDILDTELADMWNMYEGLMAALQLNIRKFLKYENEYYSDYDSFTAALQEALFEAQNSFNASEGNVNRAKKELEMFKAGDYSQLYAITQAELDLQTAKEAHELVKAKYDATYAGVQEVIAVLLN